jgi:serine/threonine protein phosphatase 1
MSFWRPSKDSCIYVISSINGMHNELNLILSRILPLRKTAGIKDILIFLGNYKSNKVLDILIKAKQEQPDQIICLIGYNESLFNNSITKESNYYVEWMKNGGESILSGYLDRAKSQITNPYLIQRQYITRFIPKEHLDFINSLFTYYETDDYIFVHGGCDPFLPLNTQDPDILARDISVYKKAKEMSKNKFRHPWKKTIITGNSNNYSSIFMFDKFITLDGTKDERVYAMEINSREIFSARKGKCRLVKESQ